MKTLLLIGMLLFFAVVVLLAVCQVLFPKKMWELFDSWKAKETPSAAYFRAQRLSGLIVLGLLFAVAYAVYTILFR